MLNSWFRRLTRTKQIPVPIHIPARKSGPAAQPMQPLFDNLADCQELLVPLTLSPDSTTQPTVKPADRLEPYDPLSQPGRESGIRAFSPAAATVVELTTVDTEYACELQAVRLRLLPGTAGPAQRDAPALQDMATQPPTNPPAQGQPPPHDLRPLLADIARIEDLPGTLDELGVLTTHAGRLEPLGNVLRSATGQTTLLVINAIQSEPQLASHLRLTLDATDAIVAGTKALCSYLGLRHATLLVNAAHNMHPMLVRRLRRFRIRVVPVRTSYPGGHDAIVLKALFRKPPPAPGQTLRAGILVLPADAVWRVGLALMHNRPVTLQPVTIAGDCLPPAGQRVRLLPIGLTIGRLLQHLAQQNLLPREPKVVLLGGPMTGRTILDPDHTVITQATQAVLLMSHKPQRRTLACIRCGWCIYGCPVAIDPIAILDALEADQLHRLARLATERCIECGVCSAICPSHLPLAQAARAARTLLHNPPSRPPD